MTWQNSVKSLRLRENYVPTIEWVSHASFVVREGTVNLICDPWLSGTAFNRGWRPVATPVFTPADFSTISHIWFSHQHPDHFYPPDLRRIPAEVRKNITILYHRTIDQKVIRFCQSLGFKEQIELTERRWFPLSADVAIKCGTWFDRDSWLAVRTLAGTLLNLNDCVVDSRALAKRIRRAVGPIDALFTQFSYAEFHGNADEVQARAASARDKLERIRIQAEVLDPRVIVPFASFIYWCNDENFYMNAEMNRVGEVAAFICAGLERMPVVLYPGERWEMSAPQDWEKSAACYANDLHRRLAAGPTEHPTPVSIDIIERAAANYLARLKKQNPLIGVFPAKEAVVELSDLPPNDARFKLSSRGLQRVPPSTAADIRMHSESFLFCLKAPWGSNALHVNARFRSLDGRHDRFFDFFRPGDWADHGYTLELRKMPLLMRAAAFRAYAKVGKRMENMARPRTGIAKADPVQ